MSLAEDAKQYNSDQWLIFSRQFMSVAIALAPTEDKRARVQAAYDSLVMTANAAANISLAMREQERDRSRA